MYIYIERERYANGSAALREVKGELSRFWSSTWREAVADGA